MFFCRFFSVGNKSPRPTKILASIGIPIGFTITGDTVEFDTAPATGTVMEIIGNLTFTGGVQIIKAENELIVSPENGDFTSIKDAIDSITLSDIDNRWVIKVGPGVYEEYGPI